MESQDNRRRWRGRVVVAGGVAVVASLAAGIAVATVPDSNGVINGCYKTNGGALRVLDSGQTCKADEHAVFWNQTGPVGPTGPTGPQGPAGPAGTGDAYFTISYQGAQMTGYADHYDVVSLTLPAGNYAVTGVVAAQTDSEGTNIGCTLYGPQGATDRVALVTEGLDSAANTGAPITLNFPVAASTDGQQVVVSCSGLNGGIVNSASLMATQVTNIHVS